MKVLLLNQMHRKTGIGSYIETMENSFISMDIDYKIITLAYDNQVENYYGDVYQGFNFPIKKEYINAVFSQIIYRHVVNKIKEYKNDGYIIHYGSNSMTPITNYDIVTLHDDGFRESYANAPAYKYFASYYGYFFILKKFLKFPYMIVLIEVMKEKLLKKYNYKGKIYVVPHYYSPIFKPLGDKISIRKELKLPANKILILSVSTDKHNKNLEIILKVISMLGNKYKLIRVGPKIGDSITFNNVDYITLNKLYNACDMLIEPSLNEGFGYPLIEAFATGLPVVCSNIPVFHEIGGDASVFINNNDPKDIVRGINEVLNNITYYKKKSIERSKLFTLQEFSKKMINVYRDINW